MGERHNAAPRFSVRVYNQAGGVVMNLKLWELLAVLAIIVLVFGPGRIAGLGGAVGKAMKDFREAMKPEEPKPASPDKGAGGKS